ncbi:MAG: hypothetical protein WC821_00820 [archaeon]|jgi:tRNA G46 methylase TrmB
MIKRFTKLRKGQQTVAGQTSAGQTLQQQIEEKLKKHDSSKLNSRQEKVFLKSLKKQHREFEVAIGVRKEGFFEGINRRYNNWRAGPERNKVRLNPFQRKKYKSTLASAYSVDIACGQKPSQLIKYAQENPNKLFVGVEQFPVLSKYKSQLKKLKNAVFIRMDAREALSLMDSNSKRVLNMSQFPYFETGVHGLTGFRKQILSETLRILRPGGTLALSTTQSELAIKELKEMGFLVRKPVPWGTARVPLEYGSEYTKGMTARIFSEAPSLIIAKKPRN